MKFIGQFTSKRWGRVTANQGTYDSATGPIAVTLTSDWGEPLATLSVNMYRPQCSHSSVDLPADCFYAKTYGGNEKLAQEALDSGMFKVRDDLPKASSGFIEAPVFQIVRPA